MKVLFVCSGNTSRSPMAEGIFRQMTGDVEVSSAGFSTYSGERASENAILVCRKHGIDLEGFTTTNISDVDFESVDLVLAATLSARDKILRLHPEAEAYTIREYAGGYDDLDIEDPSDDRLGDHVVCFFEIREALERIVFVNEMRVIFVCTGNTCRSPMAEVIFKSLSGDVSVASAGLSAFCGEKASQNAVTVCKNHGLDLKNHRARHISELDVKKGDLILTATASHKNQLIRLYPSFEIFTIREYAGFKDTDISDPIGGSIGDYEECFLKIRESLEKIVEIHKF